MECSTYDEDDLRRRLRFGTLDHGRRPRSHRTGILDVVQVKFILVVRCTGFVSFFLDLILLKGFMGTGMRRGK